MAKISRRKKFPKHKRIVDLNRLIAESYQMVGYISCLVLPVGEPVDPDLVNLRNGIVKMLDNLAAGKLIHKDVLPILGPKI
jgi:hypothetical protein